MKKVLLSLIIALTAATTVNAQKGNYFYANLGGGLHNINYATGSFGSKTPGLGFNAGIGWQWMFSEHFGVGLGINFNTQKTSGKLSFNESTPNLTDKENGLNYTQNVSFNGLKEVDKQSVLDFPLSLYYQTKLSERLRLLIGVNGFYTKVLSQDYKIKSGDISVGKFFPDYNLDYSGIEDKEHGIFNVSDFSDNTKLKKAVYGIGAQALFCYALGEKRRTEFTFGIYSAYRFTNQKDINGKIFDPETTEYHGITQSNIADKISSCNLGGIVGLRFRVGGKEKKPALIMYHRAKY